MIDLLELVTLTIRGQEGVVWEREADVGQIDEGLERYIPLPLLTDGY